MFYNTGIGTYVWIVTNRKEKRRKGKIQLFDARNIFVPMPRNQGDKRRMIGNGEEGTPNQIDDIVKAYGSMEEWQFAESFDKNDKRIALQVLPPGERVSRAQDGHRIELSVISRIFNNADFGYTRVTVERPLRLRFRMTLEDKTRFLDACPHLLDDVQVIDKTLGREPKLDWNIVWSRIEDLLHARKSRWKTPEQKLFRSVFTQTDTQAEPVHKGNRDEGYEPDSELRHSCPKQVLAV